ncbi:hypothetical protein F4780DRAFT_627662 [Xylariomycetidae sp. FL0641]|nr:hypothetical protein F4780DRAFT_627662 [Xylariomycetidae sp. FL0641]
MAQPEAVGLFLTASVPAKPMNAVLCGRPLKILPYGNARLSCSARTRHSWRASLPPFLRPCRTISHSVPSQQPAPSVPWVVFQCRFIYVCSLARRGVSSPIWIPAARYFHVSGNKYGARRITCMSHPGMTDNGVLALRVVLPVCLYYYCLAFLVP